MPPVADARLWLVELVRYGHRCPNDIATALKYGDDSTDQELQRKLGHACSAGRAVHAHEVRPHSGH